MRSVLWGPHITITKGRIVLSVILWLWRTLTFKKTGFIDLLMRALNGALIRVCRISDFHPSDHRTVFFHFASVHFKWTLVQRRRQSFWIMFTDVQHRFSAMCTEISPMILSDGGILLHNCHCAFFWADCWTVLQLMRLISNKSATLESVRSKDLVQFNWMRRKDWRELLYNLKYVV